MKKTYKVINGTSYDERTLDEVINVLERVRANGTRIVLDYGGTEQVEQRPIGQSWGQCSDIAGTVGRSGGIRVPILLHNSRSIGGGEILTPYIIKIMESKGKRVLYQHPEYKPYKES